MKEDMDLSEMAAKATGDKPDAYEKIVETFFGTKKEDNEQIQDITLQYCFWSCAVLQILSVKEDKCTKKRSAMRLMLDLFKKQLIENWDKEMEELEECGKDAPFALEMLKGLSNVKEKRKKYLENIDKVLDPVMAQANTILPEDPE